MENEYNMKLANMAIELVDMCDEFGTCWNDISVDLHDVFIKMQSECLKE